jgi:predicted nucleic acid-binding Zn ribbon protein
MRKGSRQMSGNNRNRQGRNDNVINIRRGNPDEEYDREQMQNKLRKHRRRVRRRLARLGLILILVCVLLVVWLFNRSYNSYSIVSSVSREDTDTALFAAYDGGFIRYSNDGTAYFGSSGEMLWNYSYSMSKPELRMNGDYFAIGDITGSSVLVFNKNGFLREISNAYTVTQIELSSGGLVAASLSDGSANYVTLYDTEGAQVYSVKTTLTGEGYPLSIAISDNAQELVLAYVCISGDSVKANVAFYDFSDNGQSENKRLVGGFDNFDDKLVGNVHFFGNSQVAAVSEDSITYYSIGEYPSQTQRVQIEGTIRNVFYGDDLIGLVIEDENAAYRMEVYNLSGSKQCSVSIDADYTNFCIDHDRIYMNNDSTFRIYTSGGRKIADITAQLPISAIVPTGKRGSCFLITTNYIQKISLR